MKLWKTPFIKGMQTKKICAIIPIIGRITVDFGAMCIIGQENENMDYLRFARQHYKIIL